MDLTRSNIPDILSGDALRFVGRLVREFGRQREKLLHARAKRQREFDAGQRPDFLPKNGEDVADWKVGPIPADLWDRRVGNTGPTDRKMVINALNSGARRLHGGLRGRQQSNLAEPRRGPAQFRDAINGDIRFTSPEGKTYRLNPQRATLMVRPRGLHLPEKHVWLDDNPVPGSLFDFGLFFFHNARKLLDLGSGPLFLPA